MKHLKDNPLFLLLSTGGLLGLYFPIGKLAANAQVSPFAWALLISLVPGLVLMAANVMTDRTPWRFGDFPFAFVSGILAYVVPNGLTFAAIPHIGSGLMSLMFALSPVLTAAISIALGVRPPDGRLLAGIACGLGGALLIILSRQSVDLQATSFWLLAAFVVPVSLAFGNVYRTACWPKGMAPLRMAGLTNLAASIPLVILLLYFEGMVPMNQFGQAPWAALAQVIVSILMFTVFFRLQWVGGPTYLSQIGYVAAAVGLGAGALLLGETYPLLIWAGAGLIAAGVIVSNWPHGARG